MTNIVNESLNIIEIFPSIQGETSFTGLPTAFVRLAACNLRCSWCDTTYSFGRGEPHPIASIIEKVEGFGCRHVCITGGEPLLQKGVYSLMEKLADKGFIISIETGGSLSISRVDRRVHIILDIKCPGSGMEKKNCWDNLEVLRDHDEVKFVIEGKEDYNYAKQICATYALFKKVRHVLFAPVFNILEPKDLVSWILRDALPVRLNLQTHKFIWHPETRGV